MFLSRVLLRRSKDNDLQSEQNRMASPTPPFPAGQPPRFRATVHGTVFADRERTLSQVERGEPLYLIPDPPGEDEPEVWVHRKGGGLVGHLPPEIGAWLAPWMISGGGARALAVKVGGPGEPSWRRLVLEVTCGV